MHRALERVCQLYLRLSQALLVFLVLGIFLQVVLRYLFARSLLGFSELTFLALVWIVFLMAFVLYWRRRHIVITALVDLLAPRIRTWAERLVAAGTIVLAAYVCLQLYNVWPYLRLTTPVFHIHDVAYKIAPLFAFIPIGLQSLLVLFSAKGHLHSSSQDEGGQT